MLQVRFNRHSCDDVIISHRSNGFYHKKLIDISIVQFVTTDSYVWQNICKDSKGCLGSHKYFSVHQLSGSCWTQNPVSKYTK